MEKQNNKEIQFVKNNMLDLIPIAKKIKESEQKKETELKQKARATIEHMKQPHFINKEPKIKELLREIEKDRFNWTCDCENCNNIKKKIQEYNREYTGEKQ